MSDPATTHLTPAAPATPVADSDVIPATYPEDSGTIDITGPVFARRFANLLSDRRASTKRSLGSMARGSDKHFSRRALRRYEAGEASLDMVTVSALASLYEVDIDAIVPLRTEIGIDDGGGVIAAGGVTARFAPGDPDSLLATYLRLVRRLRDQERADEVSLRREDVERLAAHLGTSGESVVERLGTLMGATKAQRRVMAGLFMTGAMVITVAVPSVAALSGGADGPDATLEGGLSGGENPELVADPAPTGSDAGETLAVGSNQAPTDSEADVRRAPNDPGRSTIDVRRAPDGPGAISIDLLDVEPTVEPVETAEPAEPAAPLPPAENTADDPADAVAPADGDAPAEPVADPIPVADPPPAPQPPPPEPAPAPAPTPPEPDDVATAPPPVPEPPSVVVDPAPAPPPTTTPAPAPPADAGTTDDVDDSAGAETVAVGPPPVPAPSPPIVDPPTDD